MKKFLSSFILVFYGIICGAQNYGFQTAFGVNTANTNITNRGFAVRVVNNEYFIAGTSRGPQDGILAKVNSAGTWLWSKKYGPTNLPVVEAFWGMDITSDGGYILVGSTYVSSSPQHAGEDIYLVKVNNAGTLQWAKAYGGSTNSTDTDNGFAVRLCPDGGFIVAGRTTSFGYGTPSGSLSDYYIVKTNSTGGLMWATAWGGSGIDYAYDVCVSYNGATHDGYVITGEARSFPTGTDNYNVAILKLNTDGGYMWAKAFDMGSAADPDFDIGYGCVQTANGDYFITGETNAAQDIFLMRLNSVGTWQWTKTYSGGFYTTSGTWGSNWGGDKLIKTATDGGFAMAAVTSSFGSNTGDPNTPNALLIKTSSDGTFSWAKAYGGSMRDIINSVQQTTDGGYILGGSSVGFTTAFDATFSENYFLMIRTNDVGNVVSGCVPTSAAMGSGSLTSTAAVVTYTLTAPAGSDNSAGLSGGPAASTTAVTNITPTQSTLCSAVLPVELISFFASCNKNNIALNWSTASELNNNFFTLERSAEGQDFETIGIVQGAGNSTVMRYYEFEDTSSYHPAVDGQGIWYYRLKQTDYNGGFEYFPITSVKFPCEENELSILPNPSSGIFSVSGLEPDTEITLFNLLGEKIISQKATEKFTTLDISSSPKGVYMIKIMHANKLNTSKIIIK